MARLIRFAAHDDGPSYGSTSTGTTTGQQVGTVATPLGDFTDTDLAIRSRDNAAMCVYWEKVDAILGGIETMRAAGETYLPKFPHEDESEYRYRLKLVKLTNVIVDIIEDLASRPFADEIKIGEKPKLPTELEDFLNDVDGAGSTLTIFGSETLWNGIAYAVDWIFVDYPNLAIDPAKPRTRAQDKEEGVRPFWSHVRASNVLEVRSTIYNGRELISYMRLLEPASDTNADRVRIMERIEGVAIWSLWEKKSSSTNGVVHQWYKVGSGTFSIGLIPLVPYMTGRREGRRWKFRPPMQAAVELQIQLYQGESNLNHAKVMTAFPMIAGNGVKPQMIGTGPEAKVVPVKTGPGTFLYAAPDGKGQSGSITLLEPAATSLKFLGDENKETTAQLRELGRQPLTAQSGNLTVITTAVAAQKGNSACKAWAMILGMSLEAAIELTALWMGLEVEPQVNVFSDFEVDANKQDLTTLDTARAAGDLSQETYWHELQRRGILDPDFDAEAEKTALLDETPGDGMGPTEGGNVVPIKTGVPPTNPKPPTNKPVAGA